MKYILKDDERVIVVLRATKLALLWPICIGILLIFLPIFLFIPLFAFGLAGIILFWYSLVVGVVWTLQKFLLWVQNKALVTNKRVIDIHQRKMFDHVVSEAPWHEIEDLSFQKKGVLPHLLDYGTIRMSLRNNKVNFELRRVPNPAHAYALLTDVKNMLAYEEVGTLEKIIDKFRNLDPTERKALLHSLQELNKDENKKI